MMKRNSAGLVQMGLLEWQYFFVDYTYTYKKKAL